MKTDVEVEGGMEKEDGVGGGRESSLTARLEQRPAGSRPWSGKLMSAQSPQPPFLGGWGVGGGGPAAIVLLSHAPPPTLST